MWRRCWLIGDYLASPDAFRTLKSASTAAANAWSAGAAKPTMIPSGIGDLGPGERMAHDRQTLQCDAGLTRTTQHLMLGAVGQGQEQMFTPADRPPMPTSNPDSASTRVSRRLR